MELLIVVTVMGILAAAAIPKFVSSLTHHRVESAARRVKADLEYLRQTARLTSRSQTMGFTGDVYTAAVGSDVEDIDARPDQYSVDLSAPPYQIESVVADFGSGTTISFDGYGMPSDAGDVVLSGGAYQRTVVVEQSGEVRLQ